MWRFLVRVAVTTFQRGRTAIWFVTRPEALGVHAVVLTSAGKIVLVRQTYIERFYNPRRRHSTLGYLSPIDFEKQSEVA